MIFKLLDNLIDLKLVLLDLKDDIFLSKFGENSIKK